MSPDPTANTPDGPGEGTAVPAEEFVRRVCEPVWRRHRFVPEGRTMIDFGCEGGELSRSFAARFGLVLGMGEEGASFDEARRRNAGVPNLRFLPARKETMERVPSEGIDLCFSRVGIAPGGRAVAEWLREFVRVLKPGGLVHMRFTGTWRPAIAGIPIPAWTGAPGVEKALAASGLVPVETTRRGNGDLWVLARKAWR